jgi:hypothetical protein
MFMRAVAVDGCPLLMQCRQLCSNPISLQLASQALALHALLCGAVVSTTWPTSSPAARAAGRLTEAT